MGVVPWLWALWGCASPCDAARLERVAAAAAGANPEAGLAAALDQECPSLPLWVRDWGLGWAQAVAGGSAQGVEAAQRAAEELCEPGSWTPRDPLTREATLNMWQGCRVAELGVYRSDEAFLAAGGPESALLASVLHRELADGDQIVPVGRIVDRVGSRATGLEASTWGRYAPRFGGLELPVSRHARVARGGVCQPAVTADATAVTVEGASPRSWTDAGLSADMGRDLRWFMGEGRGQCRWAVGNGIVVAAAPNVTIAQLDTVVTTLRAAGEDRVHFLVDLDEGDRGEFSPVGAWSINRWAGDGALGRVHAGTTGLDMGTAGHRWMPDPTCGPTSPTTWCGASDSAALAALGARWPPGTVDVALAPDLTWSAAVQWLDALAALGRLDGASVPWVVRDLPSPELRQPTLVRDRRRQSMQIGPVEGMDLAAAGHAVDAQLEFLHACTVGAQLSEAEVSWLVDLAADSDPLVTVNMPDARQREALAGCTWDALRSAPWPKVAAAARVEGQWTTRPN